MSVLSVGKSLVLSAVAVAMLSAAPNVAPAQVEVGIGVAPVCPYGYFDYAPYDCAPYGYYGPDWFVGGVFLGAGPWFHGRPGWFGHVDNRFDPRNGYHGPLPGRGAQQFNHFEGNEARDGRGNVGHASHEPTGERALPGFRGGASHAGAGHPGGRPR
jgi:hypothetical protein